MSQTTQSQGAHGWDVNCLKNYIQAVRKSRLVPPNMNKNYNISLT